MTLRANFNIFNQDSYSAHENVWKSGLFWLSRSSRIYIVFWVNFGPLRSKISKTARETYLQNFSISFTHTQVLKNGPIFVGGVFFIFGLGQILAEPAVTYVCMDFRHNVPNNVYWKIFEIVCACYLYHITLYNEGLLN